MNKALSDPQTDIQVVRPYSIAFVEGTVFSRYYRAGDMEPCRSLTETLSRFWGLQDDQHKPGWEVRKRRAALSEKTRMTYLQAIKAFEKWYDDLMSKNDHTPYLPWPVPTSAVTIKDYIKHLEKKNASLSTMDVYIQAIRWVHAQFNLTDSTRSPSMLSLLKGVRRSRQDAKSEQTPAFPTDAIARVLAAVNLTEASLRELRDVTYFSWCAIGAFRESEISGLTVEQLKRCEAGYIVHMLASKKNQDGTKDDYKLIPATGHERCFARMMDLWLERTGLQTGVIFSGINKAGRLREAGLQHKAANQIIKNMAAVGGCEKPEQYSVHSLRRRFVTTCRDLDIEDWKTIRQTNHDSVSMANVYDKESEAIRSNPATEVAAYLHGLIDHQTRNYPQS